MIVSRAPVRLSLGGGGTDLPAYAEAHGGFVLSAAIDKYVYVVANPRFHPSIRLSYSKTETVDAVEQVEHRLFREGLRAAGIDRGIELVSLADVPASCGLGSSGAFAVALVQALRAWRDAPCDPLGLAEEACRLEDGAHGGPTGRQDPYASACGGLVCLQVGTAGSVRVEPLHIPEPALRTLEASLHLFYTGVERSAAEVLDDQQERVRGGGAPLSSMHRIKQIGLETRSALELGEVDSLGEAFHAHWELKRSTSEQISNRAFDEHYAAARAAGAVGGKLVGAGGGGFFLFYARERRDELRAAMVRRGLRPMPFHFEPGGARIVADLRRRASPPDPLSGFAERGNPNLGPRGDCHQR
ncbi:MAG: hypothetical protein QM765_46760 [Myxococcales bacterium]